MDVQYLAGRYHLTPLQCGPSGPYGSPSNKLWDFPANGSSADGGKVIIKEVMLRFSLIQWFVEDMSEAEPAEGR